MEPAWPYDTAGARYRYFLVYLYALSRGGLEEVYLVYQVNIYSKHLILEIQQPRNLGLRHDA